MLLVLLGCLLPAAGAGGRGELPPLLAGAALLLGYDLRVLWGAPGPPRELSRSLRSLLLQAPVLEPGYLGEAHRMAETGVKAGPAPGPSLTPLTSFLACPIPGQEQLEREAAALFTHTDTAIGKFRAGEEAACPRPRPPQKTHLSWEGGVLAMPPSGASLWSPCWRSQEASPVELRGGPALRCRRPAPLPSLPRRPDRQSLLSEMHDARPEAAVC